MVDVTEIRTDLDRWKNVSERVALQDHVQLGYDGDGCVRPVRAEL